MDPCKTTTASLVLFEVWYTLDLLQQSHAMLCVFPLNNKTGQRTLLWLCIHPTWLYQILPLLIFNFWMFFLNAIFFFCSVAKAKQDSWTSFLYSDLDTLLTLLCISHNSFILPLWFQNLFKVLARILFNHNWTASITGSELTGMNIKAKNPSYCPGLHY